MARIPKELTRARQMARDLEQSMFDDHVRALPADQQEIELERRRTEIKWIHARIEWLESRYLLKVAESWGIEPPSKPEWYTRT